MCLAIKMRIAETLRDQCSSQPVRWWGVVPFEWSPHVSIAWTTQGRSRQHFGLWASCSRTNNGRWRHYCEAVLKRIMERTVRRNKLPNDDALNVLEEMGVPKSAARAYILETQSSWDLWRGCVHQPGCDRLSVNVEEVRWLRRDQNANSWVCLKVGTLARLLRPWIVSSRTNTLATNKRALFPTAKQGHCGTARSLELRWFWTMVSIDKEHRNSGVRQVMDDMRSWCRSNWKNHNRRQGCWAQILNPNVPLRSALALYKRNFILLVACVELHHRASTKFATAGLPRLPSNNNCKSLMSSRPTLKRRSRHDDSNY